ncbi:hypothetical protein FQN57_002468, partial [Myotisia sp. PD_48]
MSQVSYPSLAGLLPPSSDEASGKKRMGDKLPGPPKSRHKSDHREDRPAIEPALSSDKESRKEKHHKNKRIGGELSEPPKSRHKSDGGDSTSIELESGNLTKYSSPPLPGLNRLEVTSKPGYLSENVEELEDVDSSSLHKAKSGQESIARDQQNGANKNQLDKNKITQEILGADNLYKMLGLEDPPKGGDREIKIAYNKRALLVHPDQNRHPHASQAFNALHDAYEKMNGRSEVFKGDISNFESDKGDSDKEDPIYSTEAHDLPSEYYLNLYDKATPYIIQLFQNPANSEALKAVEDINMQIKKHNIKSGIRHGESITRHSINYQAFIANVTTARETAAKTTLAAELANAQDDDNLFTECEDTIDKCNKFIIDLVQRKHYPIEWGMQLLFDRSTRQLKIVYIDRDLPQDIHMADQPHHDTMDQAYDRAAPHDEDAGQSYDEATPRDKATYQPDDEKQPHSVGT